MCNHLLRKKETTHTHTHTPINLIDLLLEYYVHLHE